MNLPMNIPLGNQVAQLISAGDVHLARKVAGNRKTWTPEEMIAITTACRRWSVDPMSFL